MRAQRFFKALEEKKAIDPITKHRSNHPVCQACKDAGWYGTEVTYNGFTGDGAEVDYVGIENASRNKCDVRAMHRAPHHVGKKEDVIQVETDWDLVVEGLGLVARQLVFFPVDMAARHEHIPFISVGGDPKKE